MKSLLFTFSITTFWLFSPEALVFAGNSAGAGAGFTVLVLFVALILTLAGSNAIRSAIAFSESRESEQSSFYLGINGIMGLSGLIGTTLFASTGMLVTAGFTFNEVFYYRFPNFGFAFLLLAIVLFISFASERVYHVLFSVVVLIIAIGLLILITSGFSAPSTEPLMMIHDEVSGVSVLIPVLLLVGLDRVAIRFNLHPAHFNTCLIVAVCIIFSWILVSSLTVDHTRLASTSIPYMITAGTLAGQAGRIIMGTIVIFGSMSAVFMLILMASDYLCSYVPPRSQKATRIISLCLFTLIIGALMGGGLAGSDKLEVFIRASLLLWLAHSGLSYLKAAYLIRAVQPQPAIQGAVAGVTVLICSLLLFLNQQEPMTAALLAGSIILATALFVFIIRIVHGSFGSHHINIVHNTEVQK